MGIVVRISSYILVTLSAIFLSVGLLLPVSASAETNHALTNSIPLRTPDSQCSKEGFEREFKVFSLEQAQESLNARKERSKYIPAYTSPNTLIPIKELTYSVVGDDGSGYESLIGWYYEPPKDSVFRRALAEAILCKTKGHREPLQNLKKILSQKNLFGLFLHADGKLEKKEPSEQYMAQVEILKDIATRLEKLTSDPNPAVVELGRSIAEQILENENRIERKQPLALSLNLKRQLALLKELTKNPNHLTEQAAHLLETWKSVLYQARKDQSILEKNPDLSTIMEKEKNGLLFEYLLHPFIADTMRNTLFGTGPKTSGNDISSNQLNALENEIRTVLSEPKFSLQDNMNPGKNQGTLSGNELQFFGKNGINEAAHKLKKEKLEANRAERGEKVDPKAELQKVQNDLLGILNRYNLHGSGSLPLNHLRHRILDANAELESSGEEDLSNIVRQHSRTQQISKFHNQSPKTAQDIEKAFQSLATQSGTPFSPGALADSYGMNQNMQSLIKTIARAEHEKDPQTMALIKDFLQSADPNSLLDAVLRDPKLLSATAETLRKLGANTELVLVMKDVAKNQKLSEAQRDRYEQTRSNLRDTLTHKKPLSASDEASLLAIGILDGVGLGDLKNRISETYYSQFSPNDILENLKLEDSELKELAQKLGKSPREIEDSALEHVKHFSPEPTGMTPEIRTNIIRRLHNPEKSSVSQPEQMDILNFAKNAVTHMPQHSSVSQSAKDTLKRMLFHELTPDRQREIAESNQGPDIVKFLSPDDLFFLHPSRLQQLAKTNLFKPEVFNKLYEENRKTQDSLDHDRSELLKRLLDFTHKKIYQLETAIKLKHFNEKDLPHIQQEQNHLKILSFALEKSLQDRDQTASILMPLVDRLSANTKVTDEEKLKDLENTIAGMGFEFGNELSWLTPDVLANSITQALQLLETSDKKSITDHSETSLLNKIQKIENSWKKTLNKLLLDRPTLLTADEVEQVTEDSETLLDKFDQYGRALKRAQFTADLHHYDNNIQRLPSLIQNHLTQTLSSALDGGIEPETTEKLRKIVESDAGKKAKEQSETWNSFLSNWVHTQSPSARKVGYDPISNTLVLNNDTKLDKNLISRLKILDDFSIRIEPDGIYAPSRGYHALETWLRSKRFNPNSEGRFNYAPSTRHPDGTLAKETEQYVPINGQTALRAYRNADGTYEYETRELTALEKEATRRQQEQDKAKTAYLDSVKNYNTWRHSAKQLFGSMFLFMDPNQTKQNKEFTEAYNKWMKALDEVGKLAHIKDKDGYTGRQNAVDYRAYLKDRLIAEQNAIIELSNKVETLHAATFFALTTAGTFAGGQLFAMAGAGAAASSVPALRLAAPLLNTSSKVLQTYNKASIQGAKLAAGTSLLGVGIDLGGTAISSLLNVGESETIRKKLALYKEKGKDGWRKFTEAPKLPPNPTEEQATNWRKNYQEFLLEEAMDSNADRIPENPFGAGIYSSRTVEQMTLAHTSGLIQQQQSFEGMNLGNALASKVPILNRYALPARFAASNLWKTFHPSGMDVGSEGVNLFARAADQEHARQAIATQNKSPLEMRERSLGEVAGRDVWNGLWSGPLFALAQVPAKGVIQKTQPWFDKVAGNSSLKHVPLALGLGTVAAVQQAQTDYLDSSILDGRLPSIITGANSNPDRSWSGYGLALAQNAGFAYMNLGSYPQQVRNENQRNDLKRTLGITPEGGKAVKAKKDQDPEKAFDELLKGNNYVNTYSFLASLSEKEKSSAPETVKLKIDKALNNGSSVAYHALSSAANAIEQNQSQPDKKILALPAPAGTKPAKIPTNPIETTVRDLARVQGNINDTLTKTKGGQILYDLSPKEFEALKQQQKERTKLGQQLADLLEPAKVKYEAALKAVEKHQSRVKDTSQPEPKHVQNARKTISNYQENTKHLQDALTLVSLIQPAEAPIMLSNAVLKPDSEIGSEILKKAPLAAQALKKVSPADSSSLAANIYKGGEKAGITPTVSDVRKPSDLLKAPATPLERTVNIATDRLLKAIKSSPDQSEEKQQLMVLLYSLNPSIAHQMDKNGDYYLQRTRVYNTDSIGEKNIKLLAP